MSTIDTPGTTPAAGVDLDHTSFAVHDALGCARGLRRDLGATPIMGESLAEFRYLMLYIGSTVQGARIELMEPTGPGFLQRNLDKRGEGPHHLTFTVPDIRAAVADVRAIGLTVVGEDYEHPPWQEAFIMPDAVHGVVIQLAQTTASYPSPKTLLASRERTFAAAPSPAGATDPDWWAELWDTDPAAQAILGETHLGSTDLSLSCRLFADVLGGGVSKGQDEVWFTWPSGTVHVEAAQQAGVRGITLTGGRVDEVRIGSARLGDVTRTTEGAQG